MTRYRYPRIKVVVDQDRGNTAGRDSVLRDGLCASFVLAISAFTRVLDALWSRDRSGF
jgi:hypothetical protein